MTENYETSHDHHCPRNPDRRRLLKTAALGGASLAGASLLSCEEKILAARLEEETTKADGVAGATRKFTNWAKLEDLKEKPPKVKIGKLRLSRIILGGNLFGGWAHSRDLIYVSELVAAYNTPDKIYATFQLAEACGINAFLSHYSHYAMIERYWDAGGSMHFFADCRFPQETQISMDKGASACYINGEKTDELVAAEKYDVLEAHLEQVRKEGITAGLGAHRLITVQKVMERGITPDFWMKTFHHTNYWSAQPKNEHDNIFCREPEETKEFMKTMPLPWIAFKTLAAGAIHPNEGFRFAFEGGADIICVGMYDFQMVDDVNIAVNILNNKDSLKRERRWT
ncbi:MAG: hypothetical protein FWC43_13935 [Planctomycetaceae bacterium]|nr:hypothetical protein [Planctomycetaceae bacterium]